MDVQGEYADVHLWYSNLAPADSLSLHFVNHLPHFFFVVFAFSYANNYMHAEIHTKIHTLQNRQTITQQVSSFMGESKLQLTQLDFFLFFIYIYFWYQFLIVFPRLCVASMTTWLSDKTATDVSTSNLMRGWGRGQAMKKGKAAYRNTVLYS